jgi:hypothetical protein
MRFSAVHYTDNITNSCISNKKQMEDPVCEWFHIENLHIICTCYFEHKFQKKLSMYIGECGTVKVLTNAKSAIISKTVNQIVALAELLHWPPDHSVVSIRAQYSTSIIATNTENKKCSNGKRNNSQNLVLYYIHFRWMAMSDNKSFS